MGDNSKQTMREADIHIIVKEIVAFANCIETKQMLVGALQLPPNIGADLEQKYRQDGCNSYNYFAGIISKWISLKGNQASTLELDSALRSIEWNAAADNVKDKWIKASRSAAEANIQNVSKSGQLNTSIWFNMRDPISSFTGRKVTLKQVHLIFFPANVGQQYKANVNVKSTPVAVVGLGGIGKSEFARKFAKKYYTEFDRNVAWMNAESAQLLEESFKELAAEIGIDTANVSGKKDFLKMIKRVYERICSSKSLFIFDNVESWFDGVDAIMEYLPKGLKPDSNTPYILMTSRNRPKVSKSVEIIELSVLTEPEAVQLIQHRLDTENSEYPLQLAKLLGCLPLALQQAISYLQQEIEDDVSEMVRLEVVAKYIKSYVKIFDTEAKKLLDYKDSDFDANFEELKTTRVTWMITLEKIQVINESAIPLLTMMSFISADDIHLQMFEAQFTVDDLKAAVNTLVRFSMITKISNIVSVHRLVQRVVQMGYKEKQEGAVGDEGDVGNSLESMLNLLNAILEKLPDNITPYTTSCINHAQVAWEHALAYPKLLKQFEGKYPENCYNKAALHGMHTTNLSLLERTLSKYKLYSTYGESDEQYIVVQHSIARALQDLHKYEDVKYLCKLIHKTAADELGESHPLTLAILSNLAYAEGGLGNYSEQILILDNVMAINTASPKIGPYHNDTLASLYNKAVCLTDMKKYDEALELFKSTLALMENHHPHDRESINRTRYMIAYTTRRQGNFADALLMYRNLHAELVESFGESHTRTLDCVREIGECLLELGNHEEAMEMLKHNQELANGNPNARLQRVSMKYPIARVLLKMERYDEAISQFRIVLDELLSFYGETHPDVLTTREQLAIALENAGFTEEALEHCIFVCENRVKGLGAEHPDTIRAKEKMELILNNEALLISFTQQGSINKQSQIPLPDFKNDKVRSKCCTV